MSEHLISMHKETIIGYLIYLWIVLIFLVVICMILGRIGHGKLHIKYSKECFLIIIVVLLGYGAIKTTQGVIDINTEAYVIEEDVEYSKFYTQKAFFGDPIHISTKNGVGMVLYTVDDYPDGEYIGTVTYAKNSKIILDFRIKSKIK